ncbi:MAG: tetratricopeptide repeat protein [Acidobacteria bacterium]|nr:tetratricopeptide repeat protein [Acidobacteriota bacterium]
MRDAADAGVPARIELARSLNLQSQASSRLGDAHAALPMADQALALSNELGAAGRSERADSLKSLGMAYHIQGRFERAGEFKRQALALYRELGNRRMVGNMLNSLGETARLRGDYREAFAHYREALAIAREIGNRNGELLYLGNLGAARVGLGDYATAEGDLRQVIALASAAGYFGLSEVYRFLSEALLGKGETGEALVAAHCALALGQKIENQEHIGEAWRVLGLIASRLSEAVTTGEETRDAGECFAESLRVFTRIGMEAERARALRDWARHELEHGDRERGRAMWQEARAAFDSLGMEPEVERMAEKT